MYEWDNKTREQLNKAFTYHPPHGDQAKRFLIIRQEAKDFAYALVNLCPPSRELSVALTNLEQSVFWANAAIARNEPPPSAESSSLPPGP